MRLAPEQRESIRKAFLAGKLLTQAVHPQTGEVKWVPVGDVMRHHTPHKAIHKVVLQEGESLSTTEDHSIFFKQGEGICPTPASRVREGDQVACVKDSLLSFKAVTSVEVLEPVEHTYDLCVPGPENFVTSSGIVAHNSYSIGGVSLDLERSSKYQSLADSASQQFDKSTEAKARTIKFIKGLQQPRFGMGVRSAFGPHIGRGVLGPRSFVGV